MDKTIAIISAGLSQPSSTRLLADRLGEATAEALRDAGSQATVVVIELRDLAHDITDNLLTGFPSPTLRAAIDTVTASDAIIAVSPIFTSSYSGLFKSFFDILETRSLAGKPVLIAATGGTARHSLALEFALRPLFAYLQAIVVPTSVFAASEDWGGASGPDGDLSARITRAAIELATLLEGRSSVVATRDEVVPFDQQLARLARSV
ncbi:FMN reductase [Agreia sp. COWG]|uniref:FMN reductase n=1 Tax=Agreia sp. COWG TaxID=2773266 RepID=UPI001927E619|nr:FMN reductase [Agreia sp. COWG]CAD5997349.1 FMN reductase [Agreia sp. COWG]